MIVDAHNDVLLELLIGGGEEQSLELILRQGEDRLFERYWLPRLEAGGVGVQICPLYGACAPGTGGVDERWLRRPSSGARSRRTPSACAWSARAGSSRTRGVDDELENLAPALVVGAAWPLMTLASVTAGPLWRWVDPWDALAGALSRDDDARR